MPEMELIVKLRADIQKFMQDIKDLPKKTQEAIKVQFDMGADAKIGKDLVKTNKDLLGGLKGMIVQLAAAGGAIALFAKASPRFAAALDRLIKVFLLFFRPLGDLLGSIVNKVTLGLREIQKGRKEAVEELRPEKTKAAEIAGGAGGAVVGGVAGGLAGAKLGTVLGLPGGPAGALLGGAIGAGLGFFFGPQILAGLEDMISGAKQTIDNFIGEFAPKLAGFFQPFIDKIKEVTGFISTNFIIPITSKISELFSVFTGIFSDIYNAVSEWMGKAWTFINDNFIQPILSGLIDLGSAVLETATAWANYIYDEFISPVLERFKEWYEEITEKIIKPVVDWMQKNVIDPLVEAWNSLAETVKGIWDGIKTKIEEIYNSVKPMIDFIKGGIEAGGKIVGGALTGAAEVVRTIKPPKKQVGSEFVPFEGLYWLHRGEKIVPTTRTSSGNIINVTFSPVIHANITSEFDEDALLDKMNRKLVDELRRFR
ncbi:MAG: hypothetical protein AB1467_06825 [Candidatus Diapherotrites archaeon]